jgi:hypothetical protein
MAYRLNTPRFAAESFDHEVVVLDLEGGLYYSLEGAAAWLYRELAAGTALDGLIAACPPAYARQAAAVAQQLVSESILTATNDEGRAPVEPAPEATAPVRMTRYDDLQLLLQLDPVHDVDATGWPNPGRP